MDGPNLPDDVTDRLEYLRGEIRAERISYSELAELQSLADQIEPGDVELLEWAWWIWTYEPQWTNAICSSSCMGKLQRTNTAW